MTRGKRLMDLAIAVPLSPVVGLIVAAVWIAERLSGDRGPVLYRGVRVGEYGRPFHVMKLRTMTVGMGGGPLTGRADARVTHLGRILRRTKLDELPQLWNVVHGDMTLVGPRPEDPAFVDWADPTHRYIFSQRPGITGLAQLAFVDEESLHEDADPQPRYRTQILPGKLMLDRRYLDHRTLRLDAWILLATAARVVRRSLPSRLTRYPVRDE